MEPARSPSPTPAVESDPFISVISPASPDSTAQAREVYFDAPNASPQDPEKATLQPPSDPRLGGHNKESVELPDELRPHSSSSTSTSSAEYVDAIRPAPSVNASHLSVPQAGGGGHQPHTLSAKSSSRSLPSLRRRETRLAQKEAHPWQHLGITLGLPMILLFDLVVPCIVYYTWYNRASSQWERDCFDRFRDQNPCPLEKPEVDKTILGSAVACFGFGEIWILAARVWRLFFRRDECAPLLSRSRWELDATSWVYLVAVLMALIPFVVGSELLIPKLYLYGPSFIMVFLGALMIISFFPFTLPVGINSQPRGTKFRPFIYYAAEDFIAVDGLQDREFRIRYNERYEGNKSFRKFFLFLTSWWILGVCLYETAVSLIIWILPFHIAFGLSFGVLFSWIATWALFTYLFVELEMRRENRMYEAGEFDA